MCPMKTSGGLSHGRGLTESVITKWVHSLPFTVPITQALEGFTGVHSVRSEQHKGIF